MHITAIKTPKIGIHSGDIYSIIDAELPRIEEGSIIAVTSKIVSICEGSVVPHTEATKEELITKQADLYLPAELSKYGHHFTITNNTLVAVAGIDESNGEGYYILWPRDTQKTANDIRKYLAAKHGLKRIGIVITDSTCQPLRRGTTGIALAHSGFKALHDYRGKPDLFNKPFGVTQANVSGGLAAAAVLAMGEGAEQTPLSLITELPTITFQTRDPSEAELAEITLTLEDDLFAPFLTEAPWQQGESTSRDSLTSI